jgi:hypothetical protein
MDAYYNRYQQFFINGEQTVVPFVPLPSKTSDQRYIYRTGFSRLDKVSQQFYGTPFFGWYGGLEWNIPNNSLLTIPYPLISSLQDYKNGIENYFFYYGR